jgi:hypothetical protein
MPGYHLKIIPKGKLGEFSKIEEEFLEFLEALEQDSFVMALVELSDLIGACYYFLRKEGMDSNWQYIHDILMKQELDSDKFKNLDDLTEKFNLFKKSNHYSDLGNLLLFVHGYVGQFNLKYADLYKMHTITERAFLNGQRK